MTGNVHFLRTSRQAPNLQSIKARAIEVGYNGSAMDVEYLALQCNAMFGGDREHWEGLNTLDGLTCGAMIAFREGRPGNIQALLAANKNCLYEDHIQTAIRGMFNDSRSITGGDIAEAIHYMKPDEAKKFLGDGLLESILCRQKSFARALMEAGAEAGGLKEEFLRIAVQRKDKDMAALLGSHGASFDKAILFAQGDGQTSEINDIRAMKKQIDRDNRPPSLLRRIFRM